MKFVIEINCDNAAFYEGLQNNDPDDDTIVNGVEIASILQKLRTKTYGGTVELGWEMEIFDSNGNRVGKAVMKR